MGDTASAQDDLTVGGGLLRVVRSLSTDDSLKIVLEPAAESIRVATDALLPFCHETEYETLAMDPEPPMRMAYEVVKALAAHALGDHGPAGDVPDKCGECHAYWPCPTARELTRGDHTVTEHTLGGRDIYGWRQEAETQAHEVARLCEGVERLRRELVLSGEWDEGSWTDQHVSELLGESEPNDA